MVEASILPEIAPSSNALGGCGFVQEMPKVMAPREIIRALKRSATIAAAIGTIIANAIPTHHGQGPVLARFQYGAEKYPWVNFGR